MNVQEIADRVKRTFGDEAGIQITDSDILQWVNDGQLQISADNEDLLETVGSASIVANQAEYTQPSNLNVLRSLMYDNRRLRAMSFSEFNEYLDGFRKPVGENPFGPGVPEVFMVYGGTITLFPTPASSLTDGLRLYYSRHPATVTTLADALTVPERYHTTLLKYCLKRAYELDENTEMMVLKKGEYDESIQKLKGQEKTTSNEYYPRITTLPEDDSFFYGGL